MRIAHVTKPGISTAGARRGGRKAVCGSQPAACRKGKIWYNNSLPAAGERILRRGGKHIAGKTRRRRETVLRNDAARKVAMGGMIAALYVVLTFVANLFGLASGVIQVRLSEVLCVLPVFTPVAIPGLWVGCLLANLLTGCVIWDVIFGSLATLIGAVGTYLLRKKPMLWWIPPVVSNMAIIPPILMHAYGVPDAWWFLVLTVGAGELISCALLGFFLRRALLKAPPRIWG